MNVASDRVRLVTENDPPLGRREGYPLVNLTPHDNGIEVDAYFSQTPGEYLEQTWALLKRNFREGPHDNLGTASELHLASTQNNAFGLLIDGEQVDGGADEAFRLACCEVDLLATAAE